VLVSCVESLAAARAARILVVDNAVPPGHTRRELGTLCVSGPDSGPESGPDRGPDRGPDLSGPIEVLETGVNLGYGSGANRGVACCSGEFVLICNPDLVVEADSLKHLCEALSEDPDLAIVGPRVLELDGTRYPSARRFPSLLEGAGHAFAGLVAPGNAYTRRYRMTDLSTERTTRVDWVSGSCMLVRRQAFEELGGFDETYFMYGEDVDICWRAHRSGWGVAYVPAASVIHTGGVSTAAKPYTMLVEHHRSALRFATRSLSGPRRVAVPAVAAALGVRLSAELVRQTLRSPKTRGRP
jgi:N-acetylglucosaminyl-diphospho-decaprenol L-rhamnosyltransferase